MTKILDIQKQAAELSTEEKESLLAYLIHDLSDVIGASDAEVIKREEELDSGEVQAISHQEFLAQVGRP